MDMVTAAGTFYAAVREDTMKRIKNKGLWYEFTKIKDVKHLKPGDHICHPTVILSIVSHHAIVKRVINDDMVEIIHYNWEVVPDNLPASNTYSLDSTRRSSTQALSAANGLPKSSSLQDGSLSTGSKNQIRVIVIRKNIENLAHHVANGALYRIDYENEDKCYSPRDAIERAESLIGKPGVQERTFDLFVNNCEHFATWCKTGQAFSRQSGTMPD